MGFAAQEPPRIVLAVWLPAGGLPGAVVVPARGVRMVAAVHLVAVDRPAEGDCPLRTDHLAEGDRRARDRAADRALRDAAGLNLDRAGDVRAALSEGDRES